ncbi:MAG: thiol oxidoreductase [Siculibacillus sp.]|nr:thiol oxidoreductase [Siculibacillus sp.]
MTTRPRSIAAAVLVAAATLASGAVEAGEDAAIGRALFRRAWVPAPSATRADDGLGPHFDARACAACHPAGDRPAPALDRSGELPRGMIARAARPDGSPDPTYGHQLQAEAVTGLAPEARIRLVVSGSPRRFAVVASALADGPPAPDTVFSLRLAPALFGVGAIEAVPEAAIRALADPDDRDGDGISGRVSEVVDRQGDPRLGRWGFRATGIDLADQVAAAFSGDMGLSTARRPGPHGDCTESQTACRAAPAGSPDSAGEHEIDEAIVARIAAFLETLERPEAVAPSPRRAKDTARGAAIWANLGCAGCHAPLEGAGRTIWSDLLLHDMGPGLAAGDPAHPLAREWRTAPLLGLGDRLARRTPLLHDGRARTLEEAVSWHGGEASAAVRRWRAASPADRRALTDHLSTFR